ncbi:flavohemoprotein b5/b5R-like protein [Angomonas deanei]|uniref:Cytochrome b5-like Heme/Steroid binding domain containing protein, putative n=1 Tax=Angomonas deanei TaxID=59799 RepID=A0A7G2C8D9_9TRYP|nr:flavohemoprotein b5/b5R-like protein [Angomonas deanei]CAD2215077.1 Cytochrome b5-like Heme/Steroid binding domain containing protein, putative [Angomonas deanei]|eukprot:EPY35941.1 flavohemoprotein b5/b5R-like protein [Angomonas deanei]
MTAHPHIIRNIPRGKVPVEQGHSMRDWSQRTYEKVSEQKKTHTPSYRSNRLSIEEVRQHNTPEDLWIVIHNVVYDCTEFVRYHPGGKKLLYACGGREATAVYDAFHPWINCETMMEGYAVGVVDNKL